MKVGTISSKVAGGSFFHSGRPFDNNGFLLSTHASSPVVPNDIATLTQVQAETNPSKPDVSVPQLLGELKDIPSMLRLKGRRQLDSYHSSSAVGFNFGWAPLIQDLLKMADFSAHVDRKIAELERLHSGRGLSRSRTVFSETILTQGSSTTFQSAWGVSASGFVTRRYSHAKWGSVNWIPSVPFKGTAGELAQQARYLVHGWDASPYAILSTAWELMPWSWFIDYFANIGDYLSANRNGAGAIATMGCSMEHRRTDQQQVVTAVSSNATATGGRYVYETKSRVLTAAGITTTVPFLSIGQLVTMSSLAQSLRRG
jgi:hypothetical protein